MKTIMQLRQRASVTFAMCCFSWLFGNHDSFAAEASTEPLQVREEETQLARKFAVREASELPFEYSLAAGYREDGLTWSIANGGVNIASEVGWKTTAIAQLRASGKVNLGGGWLIRGYYATGAVKSGSNQDSDYAGNNRTQEYSRSNNRTGGAVRDLSIGLGAKFRLFYFENGNAFHAVPLAGLSIHQQSLTMYDGVQTIPANGAITGLHNSYAAQWRGSWVGMDVLLELAGNILLNGTVEYHHGDYTAEADWNLRTDFAHPVSFRHVARGRGKLFSAGASYRLSRNFMLNVSLERQKWDTHTGYDQTNFSYGVVSYYTLNPVRWDSTAYSLGAVYQY